VNIFVGQSRRSLDTLTEGQLKYEAAWQSTLTCCDAAKAVTLSHAGTSAANVRKCPGGPLVRGPRSSGIAKIAQANARTHTELGFAAVRRSRTPPNLGQQDLP